MGSLDVSWGYFNIALSLSPLPGYERHTLRRHFPDLALALKQHHRQAAEQRELQKEMSELERATRREEKKLAHNTLRAKLETTFQTTEHTPIPLKKVAQQLGYGTMYLRKYFPDQCHAFVSRYKEFSTERSRIREQQMCNEVSEIVLDLHNQGKNSNSYEVSKVLKHPGVFKNPKVRAVFNDTRRAIASTQ